MPLKILISGDQPSKRAAKNHQRVTVLTDPADYKSVLDEIDRDGEVKLSTRRKLATKYFQ